MTTEIRNAMCSRGVLASLSISSWTGNKMDRALSAQQATSVGARQGGAIRVHKSLISDPLIKQPLRIATEARNLHNALTLPWHYDGVGLLPTEMVIEYDTKLGVLKSKFWEAVQALQDNYSRLIVAAANDLGDAFDPADYPHAAQLRHFYRWNSVFDRIPTVDTNDMRLEVPEEVIGLIREQLNQDLNPVIQGAIKKMIEVIDPVVNRLRARQTDASAKVFNSTFDRLEELPDIMRKFNVLNDPGIDEMIADIDKAVISAEAVRTDPGAVDQSLEALLDIQQRLAAATQWAVPAGEEE